VGSGLRWPRKVSWGDLLKADFLIVGAGVYGATLAEKLASAGHKCIVMDRRQHLAGNCHTENREGIITHEYGPHVFHTSSDLVWEYVNQFAEFVPFVNRVKAIAQGRVYSLPVSLMTFSQFWGVTTPAAAEAKLQEVRIKTRCPANLEEWMLSEVGEEVYRLFFYGYTKKQWGREPRLLPATIVKRLPIRMDFNDNYYHSKYQAIPAGGYTAMVASMLDHPNIQVRLGESPGIADFGVLAKKTVYTGAPDELCGYSFGELEYRSLSFSTVRHEVEDMQGNAIINHCDFETPYTRTVEHKHFSGAAAAARPFTYVTSETPVEWSPGKEAYYPIPSQENRSRHRKYQLHLLAQGISLGGRLGLYKYLDMDQAIGAALRAADVLLTPDSVWARPYWKSAQ